MVREYGYEYDAVLNKELYGKSKGQVTRERFMGAMCLRSGRDALKVVAREFESTTVLIPALACDSMILPFEMYGHKVKYYKLNEDYSINRESLYSLIPNEDKTALFLYMDYFGNKAIEDAELEKLRASHPHLIFIEDRTHNLLVESRYTFKPDFTVASLRKWIDIPDGGLLWTDREIKEEYSEDLTFYSPLNGAGLEPVTRVLKESGFENITVVEEQKNPDGNFPTCPYPNPEIKEALTLGLEYCKKVGADLLLATDPDCDRVGIAVKDGDGEYVLLSGNEVGLLLLDYICSQRTKHNKMPANPVMVKTIVTMDLGERIATHYGVRTVNVLTGFKFIGEQIGLLEKQGKEDSYIFGFEESYGYLSGSYVRDKDGVNGAYLIAEMFAYYKTRGISLLEKLNELFSTYGYCLNTLHSFTFEGASGFTKMQEIMKEFHKGLDSIGGLKVERTEDYSKGLNGLPKSDVLKYLMEGNCSVVVRPSGTEPKLKTYISVSAKTKDDAEEIEKKITEELNGFFK